MTNNHKTGTYAIRIKGHLSQQRLNQFDDMTSTLTDDGETHLIGQITDQAALHSLLRTIRDAGLELLAVNRIEDDDHPE